MNKPLSLSDRQLRLLEEAAKAVPVSKLDEFLQQLASPRCKLHSTPSSIASLITSCVTHNLEQPNETDP
jgi:hypothetical protein